MYICGIQNEWPKCLAPKIRLEGPKICLGPKGSNENKIIKADCISKQNEIVSIIALLKNERTLTLFLFGVLPQLRGKGMIREERMLFCFPIGWFAQMLQINPKYLHYIS